MQLLYFITTVTSQVHSARHHQRAGYSALSLGTESRRKRIVLEARSTSFTDYKPNNSIPRKLPAGNSTGYFTCYIEILREICNSTARVK